MAIISSFGSVQALSTPKYSTSWQSTAGSVNLYGSAKTYAEIYKTQPNVRICVDFIARNIAQLGWHIYRRIADNDRQRLSKHALASLLYRPNPATTRYRMFEDLASDLGIYFNAFWLKVRGDRLGLVRLPPESMQIVGGLLPSSYVWTLENGEQRPFAPSEIVHFRGYNPDPQSRLSGLSPMETLRRILAEEEAAGEYRQGFWLNAGRMEGVIQRPAAAPKWQQEQRDRFRNDWHAMTAGGAASGTTAILEDGMEWKQTSFNARDSEYTVSGKLRREICASAYHIPLPLVGILDHATFSNIKEQHRHLYADCLGPTIEMISEEIEAQLLPEFDDVRDVYVEANIAEKLKGSFEEQASSLQTAVGRPWMTVNEARSLQNLSRDDDPASDKIGAPLNMDTGTPDRGDDPPADDTAARADSVLRTWNARLSARLAKAATPQERVTAFDAGRWARELAQDLTPIVGEAQALQTAERVTFQTLRTLKDEAAHV